MKFFDLKISKITRLTPDSVEISFEIPQNQKLIFSFLPGQYLTLEAEINGEIARRAYSICSFEGENQISVAIKQIENGLFSTFANQILKQGETLKVAPAQGKFAYIWEIFPENLGLFAAGSGITPILSIIKSVLKKTSRKILLIYSNKSKNSTMFFSEIEALKKEFQDQFFVEYLFTQSAEKNAYFGRINQEFLNFILKSKYQHLDLQRFYICGPQKMVSFIKEELSLNFDESKIHTELFSVEEKQEKTFEGTSVLNIKINGNTQNFSVKRSQPILESLLNHQLEVSYSCRNGVCSSCLAKIEEGKAEMVKNQTLSQKEIENGMILTCQAHPISENLTINFDY